MIIQRGLRITLAVGAAVLLLPQLVCSGSFRLGSINSSPVEETRKFWPLANYLARQLQSEGISQGKVVVAGSIPVMSSFMKRQQVDLYIDSLFPSWAVSRLSGSRLLLRRWKMGTSDYKSVIFTRKGTGVTRLADLKGQIIAFEEPFASSGYFFPKIVLLEKGLRLVLKRQAVETVNADEVGYVFTHSDTKTMFLVLNGVVAAGATEDQKYIPLAKKHDNLRILHETISFPRHIVSHRADLPANFTKKIKEVLLNLHQTAEGRQVLQEFESTTKFDELPERDLQLMSGFQKYVDAELKLQR